MKKFVSVLLTMMMTLTAIPFSGIAAQEDYATRGEVVQLLLEAADDYNPQVQKTDIIKGYGDGNLHEEQSVTRAEALIMLNRAFGGFPELTGNNLRLAIPKEDFSDIPEWAQAELAPVFDAGIVAGTGEGKFSPDQAVTTQQMELFIDRVFAIYGTNPKDSFYASVNKNALNTLEIPAGGKMAGTLYAIRDQTNQQVGELIKEAAATTPPPGSAQEKIKILYDNFTDMNARNDAGYTPIEKDLQAIEKIKNVSELDETMVMADSTSVLSMLTGFTLTIDAQDSNKYLTMFQPASAALTKQVYNGESEIQKNAYLKYITTLLTLCGEDDETAARNAQAFFEFEKQLSSASLTPAEQYDLEKTYNIYSLDELQEIFFNVDLEAAFTQTGLKDNNRILVQDKGNMTRLAELLTDENIDTIKNYLKIELIKNCAGLFGEDFRNAGITYNQEAMGIQGAKTLEEEAAESIASVLSDYVGQAYAEKYCSDEVISDITGMIHDIIDIYKERISKLDWMSETTKEKALLKLDTMRINVGAPDYSKADSPLDAAELKSAKDGGSYYQNMIEIAKAMQKEDARLSAEPVDKDQWITTPQTVNAFYMPSFNSVNFPMAFLQAPIYDQNASYEENLGGVGFVIGHELTHAFDSNGAQYDENGNAVNWWTDADKQAFELLCNEVIAYFDGVETAPGIVTDGTLTLTENIADLGAISCITEIGEKKENFDFKKMFESYAKLWMSTASREYLQSMAYADVHSSARVRVDRVLQSCNKFYEVYGIGENDGMFVSPEKRVSIW